MATNTPVSTSILDYEDIHPRHKMFADEWLTGENTGKPFNGRAAYEFAGYSNDNANPSANPSKLLRHPKVHAYIKSRMDEMAMTAEEVLMRFTDIARAQYGDILKKDPGTGRVAIDHTELEKRKAYVKNFGYDSNGNLKVEFHDQMRALENVARVLDMFKTTLQGPGGGAIPVQFHVQFVAPDGTGLDLGPTNDDLPDMEDFSELDRMADEMGLPSGEED